jgi:cardiolipin synthase A/B
MGKGRFPLERAVVASMLTLFGVLVFRNLSRGEKTIERPVQRLYDLESDDFKRSLSVLLGPELKPGNSVELLRNGDEAFPAMLMAIESAKRTVCFETFIYWSGSIGRRFAEALSARARAGVRVHVLLDWLGSLKMDASLLDAMKQAGVQVRRFHRPRLLQLGRMNNRTHRKLLIVDGEIGFTGGVGIADQWQGHAQDPCHWRDSHFKVRGPVVSQMLAAFLDNWVKATGAALHGPEYFPKLVPAGQMTAQMFWSSPNSGSGSTHLMYLLAVTSARRSVLLQSAYFVPDRLAVDALAAAARRGLDVRILVPGAHIDRPVVRYASKSTWPELLQAGVRIAEYQPTMMHCKILIVDSLLVSVGSTNFDSRSFRLNDEANLNVMDAEFGAAQVRVFEEDWRLAQEVSIATLQQASPLVKAGRELAASFRLQL